MKLDISLAATPNQVGTESTKNALFQIGRGSERNSGVHHKMKHNLLSYIMFIVYFKVPFSDSLSYICFENKRSAGQQESLVTSSDFQTPMLQFHSCV